MNSFLFSLFKDSLGLISKVSHPKRFDPPTPWSENNRYSLKSSKDFPLSKISVRIYKILGSRASFSKLLIINVIFKSILQT